MTETDLNQPGADPNTGQGLMDFLDASIEKGWLNVNSAKALKTASQKLLSVESGWENLDLRGLDLDGLYDRFRNLKRNDYSDDTMRIYKSRAGQAVKMHLARLDNDPAWKTYGPTTRSSGTASSPRTRTTGKGGPVPAASPPAASEPDVANILPMAATRTPLMQFPYPLRDDLDVHLNLPRDLTKAEAERLCRYISTLPREEQRAITAGVSAE